MYQPASDINRYENPPPLRIRRDWSQVHQFTPELYAEYMSAPLWQVDSEEFNSEGDYHNYYVALVKNLVQQSKAKVGRWQQEAKQAAEALEREQPATSPIFDPQDMRSQEPLPLAISQVDERVALLSANPPKALVVRQQESEAQYVAALNQLMSMVYEANNYESLCADAHYAIQFYHSACFKWVFDYWEPGIFNEPGRLTLDLVPMDCIFPDPNAKKMNCDYMNYIVQKHEMEIGEIQARYPFTGPLVSSDFDTLLSDTSISSRNNEDYIQSPQPKLARDGAQSRQGIAVYECWIKDSRLKFEPEINDSTSNDFLKRYKVDADGYLIGKFVRRYPDGRQIIVTADAVLKDVANPTPHGQFPYVFANGSPRSLPWSAGNARKIMTVTRKINRLISNIDRYLDSEVPRPMQKTAGAILDPNLSDRVPNDPSYIIEMAPGGVLERRQAMDIPPSAWTYAQFLQATLDMASGSSAVMRGQLEEGSQLSAEAMNNLQQFASSRLALETGLFKVAAKQLGYQLMWWIRATVRSQMKVIVELPNGEQQVIDWKSDRTVFEEGDPIKIRDLRMRENYLVVIKAGTGSPGAQQAQQAGAQALYNDKAIDREAFLDSIEYPGRQAITQRMRQRELEDIKAKAEGKALGVSVGEQIKQEKPGRRPKV